MQNGKHTSFFRAIRGKCTYDGIGAISNALPALSSKFRYQLLRFPKTESSSILTTIGLKGKYDRPNQGKLVNISTKIAGFIVKSAIGRQLQLEYFIIWKWTLLTLR